MLDLLTQQVANGILVGAAYALGAVGLTMVFGVLRQINFAHGEFFMLGAFGAWAAMNYLGLQYIVSIPAALLLSLVVALAMSRLIMERLVDAPFHAAVLATLGVQLVLQNAVRLLTGGTFKLFPGGWLDMVTVLGVTAMEQRVVVIASTVVLFALLEWMIRRAAVGKAMRAVAQNHEAAVVFGIDLERVTRFTFCLGILLASLAGVLMGPLIVSIYPEMGQEMTFRAFAITVIGGMGNVKGALLSALLLGIIESFVAGFVGGQFRQAVGYGALITVLMWRPYGLFAVRARF